MGLLDKFRLASQVATKDWSQPPHWSTEYPINRLSYWGNAMLDNKEQIEAYFESYVEQGFKKSGPVFSCISTRQMILSEARFVWRRYGDGGRPEEPFRDDGLKLLEKPWPGGTTGDLIARMEQDGSLAGNFFATTTDDFGRYGKASKGGRNRRIVRMRPDWVTIIIGSPRENGHSLDLDARIIGFLYEPRGSMITDEGTPQKVLLMPDEVVHYTPEPDPIARYRGMSWVTTVIVEIAADISSNQHKQKFFDNAAVPNLAVSFDKDTSEDAFDEFVEEFREQHQGSWNAYKTLFLMGGADVTPLTMDFRNLDFANIVGKGENRIANAAGVPSAWVGFSEGMQGSSLNAGNLNSLRRRLADGTIRPLWRKMAASLEVLLDVPEGAHLWYDERDVAALREDMRDLAEVMQVSLNGIEAGIRGGYDPDALVEAFRDYDITKLIGTHTGLMSVQMMATDQEGQRGQEEATTREIEARAIAALAMQGFEIGSIAAYMESGDVSQLRKDPNSLNAAQASQAEGIGAAQQDIGQAQLIMAEAQDHMADNQETMAEAQQQQAENQGRAVDNQARLAARQQQQASQQGREGDSGPQGDRERPDQE